MNKIFALVMMIAMSFIPMSMNAGEVYRSANVRFTLIDEGTIRLEYAPDGKFVDNKSFVAVNREYADVKCSVKENAKQLVITTSCMRLVYKKDNGPLTKDNLSITSIKGAKVPFTWVPGKEQKGNLKGTYRTLDGYDGEFHQYNGKKPMPIEDGILATDGWTLIDDSQSLLFDGAKDWDWVTKRTSAEGAQDWYFMAYGHDYKKALKSFTKFAGRVPLPPRYAFGYWWSRYWSYSDQDFRNLISNFKEYDLPLDVLVIDMDWHPISEAAGGGWTGWDWNESLFPDYKQFLKYLDDEGVKATMNLHPADGVRPFEKKYDEFMRRIGKNDGKTYEWLGSDKTYVKALFDTYLHPYMEEGVDFWWLDWQQWLNDKKIPELSNTFWCNYIWFSDMELHGNKRPMLYHRWGGLGNHRYQIGFSGDSYITWESLKFLPYFNSTASNVLYGYWSHDIGGHQNHVFETPVEPQLYTRAMQMGEYLPIIRSHSTKNQYLNKEPWAFNRETEHRLANVINGRYALVPYIYTMAREDYETGVSLCRPMYYDYPEAKEAYEYREQYMFGNDMMIAPVTKEVDASGYARMNVWLPEGEWLEYETGEMLKGGRVIERAFTMDEYPVYIKAGSIIPYYGKVKNLSGTDQPVIVRVFPGAESGEFSMYEDNGEDREYAESYATTPLSYSRQGNTLTVKIGSRKGSYKDMPAKRQYTVALPCQYAPSKVTVDGKAVNFVYDGQTLETKIDLGKIDCAAGATVSIELPENYAIVDGTKAKFARIQTAVAEYKYNNCGMVYTERFGYLEQAPLRMGYHPEKQAETMNTFNDYYNNLPIVLFEQIGEGNAFKRFLEQINEGTSVKIEDVTAESFAEGFDVKFYNNENLEGGVVATTHWDKIDMFESGSPAQGVGSDHWSAIIEGKMVATTSGQTLISLTGDDGYRLFIDGKLQFANWAPHSEETSVCVVSTEEGKTYNVRIEYFDNEYNGILRLKALTAK